MNFIRALLASIWGPSFYGDISSESLTNSLLYFLKLSLLTACVFALALTPGIFSSVSKGTLDKLASAFPADLQINIQNGQVSTNESEPIYIKDALDPNDNPKNILVIDTKTDFSSSQFTQYSTFAILKKDYVTAWGGSDENNIRVFSLDKVKNLTITKDTINGWIQKITPWLIVLNILGIIVIALFLSLFNFFTLFVLLISGALLFLLSKLLKYNLSYKSCYKIAIHAATLPLILETLLMVINVFGGGIDRPDYAFTLLLLLIAVLNLNAYKSQTMIIPK